MEQKFYFWNHENKSAHSSGLQVFFRSHFLLGKKSWKGGGEAKHLERIGQNPRRISAK